MKKRNLVSYLAILMAIGFIIAVVGIIIDGQVMQESYETTAAQSYNYRMAFLAMAAFAFLVCLVAIICMNGLRQLRSSEVEILNEHYTNLLKRYYDAINDMELLQKDIESIRKKKREQIESLQQQLRLCSVNPSDNHECNVERLVLDSRLVSHFHSLASKASRVSDAEWNALMQLLEIHFPVFTQRISSPQLTESERRVCMLIRLRFVPTEMAALMDVSVQQITNIRSRINSKLFRRKGAQGVDVLLNSIR